VGVSEESPATLTGHIESGDGPVLTDDDIVVDRQRRCAAEVVKQLLERTGLAASVDGESLRVNVGDGNWISFSFEMKAGENALSLMATKKLRRGGGKSENGKSGKAVWCRSKGFPSLHFQVQAAGRAEAFQIRGHVDAADPTRHPIAHLVRDYLPAHGVGTHPTAEALLGMMNSNSLG
jgi:hypothetical protein